jgi:hypothetical protein
MVGDVVSEGKMIPCDDDDGSGSTYSSSDDDEDEGSDGSDDGDDDDDDDSGSDDSDYGWEETDNDILLLAGQRGEIATDSNGFHNSSPAISAILALNAATSSKLRPMGRSESAPVFKTLPAPAALLARMNRADSVMGLPFLEQKSMSLNQKEDPKIQQQQQEDQQSPLQCWEEILHSKGISSKKISAIDSADFFLTMTEDNIKAYDMAKVTAVRNSDVAALQACLDRGEVLQCCNRFGESILHAACRRGTTECVQFLLETAHISARVMDDYGRTAFHDACWTGTPNFELIRVLLNHCPDLLLIADKRGSTPLEYIRKDSYGVWCEFLHEHADLLVPSVLNQ